MKLYIPFLTLNFNDLISNELISPKKFYNQRNFGTNRHFETNLSLSDEFITLYKFIPNKNNIKSTGDIDLEFKPMVLSVDIDNTDDKLVKINKDVYIYYGSIYIEYIKALFYDKNDFKETILRTKYIKEVKIKRLDVGIIDTKAIREFNLDLKHLKFLTKKNKNIIHKELVEIDELIDKIKGIYYYNSYNNNKSLITNGREKQIEIYDEYYNFIKYITNKNLKGNKKIKEELKQNLKLNGIYENKREKNKFLTLFKHNILYMDSTNEIIKFSSNNDKKVFNIILNKLLLNPKGRKEYYSTDELKNIFIEIGNELNESFGNESEYRYDLMKVYNRFINEKINIHIDSLKNDVIKNFYACILKYDNIEELDLILSKNNVRSNFMAYSFVGVINGFSNFSKIMSNKVNNYNTNVLIPNQMKDIKNKLYFNKNINILYKKDIYRLVGKLKNEKNRFKLINYVKSSNESMYSFKNTGNIFNIYIESDSGKYRIALYKTIYKNKYFKFLNEIKELGISKKILVGKYKYFNISLLDKNNVYDLSLENEKNIKEILSKTLKDIK